MTIQEQLQDDLKTAMRAGEKQRVEVIRMAIAALKNARLALLKEAFDASGGSAEAVDSTQQLTDQAMQDTLAKEVKRRREAAELYRKNGRTDLSDQEDAEAAILEGYLPRQMTAEELRPLVAEVIAGLGVTSAAEMGKVMPALMQQFKGKADGRIISQLAREILTQK